MWKPSLFLFLALWVGSPGAAQAVDVAASTAEVTFEISHPAKQYEGQLLDGGADVTAHFDPTDISKTGVDVAIRVAKFNSDNTRRDSHMMEVLEGLIFPTITWKTETLKGVSGPLKAGTYEARASGPLELHGKKLDLSIPIVMKVTEDGTVEVTSEFSIQLVEYDIERPTLVFVPIANDVPIKVRMTFAGGPALLGGN